jgi:hypothetical protein
MSQPITDPKPHPAPAPGQEEPGPLSNGPDGPRRLVQKFDARARNVSLLVVAILASLPIVYAGRSTTAAPRAPEPKEREQDQLTAMAHTRAKVDLQHDTTRERAGQSARKADGGANGLSMTGPAGLRIALDSPAAILSRANELALDQKQRQELTKLDGSARDQARKLLTDKQRQQLGEIPPEWLSMMQMAQLQETMQQMQHMMKQIRMSGSGQGQTPMGQGGQMQDMPQMMKMMQQAMGQGGTATAQGGMGPDMMQQMMRMMGQGGTGQGGTGTMCPMMGRAGMGQGGTAQGGSGQMQDMMQMMQLMQQMMNQGVSGRAPTGQGGAGQDMMQMMRMMQLMQQMMKEGGQMPTERKGN